MAEFFMYEQGRDTLVVYDDLSKQAAAYRQLSLLVRRPPDVSVSRRHFLCPFAAPLERASEAGRTLGNRAAGQRRCQGAGRLGRQQRAGAPRQAGEKGKVYVGPLDKEHAVKHDLLAKFPGCKVPKVANSGGLQAAMPIIETLEGEVSPYPPTIMISIPDGQMLAAGPEGAWHLASDGRRHLRIARRRQGPFRVMKSIAGGLKLDLANFRELEAFAQLQTPNWTRPRKSNSTAAILWWNCWKAAAVRAHEDDQSGHGDLRRHEGLHRQGAPGEESVCVGRSVHPAPTCATEGGRAQRFDKNEKFPPDIEKQLGEAITAFQSRCICPGMISRKEAVTTPAPTKPKETVKAALP